ncbi:MULTISPECIES: type II CAAX prenyl endopeptidase Rce1 family protein [Aerosakkonema]|uniref:CPBP family glutamic-type intramembrane protease n=1 Tax=Aerosakkonema TaxID=1246629 RepID=UPI0035BB23A1
MKIRQFILALLTLLVILFFVPSLLESRSEPQIQSRLELYQTNLLLDAGEWQGEIGSDSSSKSAREALIGAQPVKTAQKQYMEARKEAQTNLEKAIAQLKQYQNLEATPLSASEPPLTVTANPDRSDYPSQQPLRESIDGLESLINELDLDIGILQARQGEVEAALKTWQSVSDRSSPKIGETAEAKIATVLMGLWSNPPQILPDAEQTIQKSLDGWFRYQGLSQLYNLQQRSAILAKLQAAEQEIAQQAVVKLAIVAALPTLGFLIGVGLLIFLLAQRSIRKENSLLAQNENVSWSTPWDAETIWQVFIVGFFGMQLLISVVFIPLAFKLLNLTPAAFDVRSKAIYVFTTYMLVALGGVLVLYFSVKSFLPLPEGWFRFDLFGKWFLWGLGGYFVALPLVIVVSLINQEIWKGEGGSNPLLSLALESKDGVALAIFFFTAAIAAPLFEEFLFRGFLLPSLTRYIPVWGATIASSLLFAVAHLSLSEVLPLTTLGIVLAVVYTRSRNLLAPMLLHSLWNSGTLLSLFILGSGST